jgi:serine/threonine-protein kinase RsbW
MKFAVPNLKYELQMKCDVPDWEHPTVEEMRRGDEVSIKNVDLHPFLKAQRDAVMMKMEDALRNAGINENDCFQVQLIFEELLKNALHHGNRTNPNSEVNVKFDVTPQKVSIYVGDQGKGFDVQSVLDYDPTADENLENPNGRGVMLSRQFSSSLQYSPQGNEVFVEKIIESNDALTQREPIAAKDTN